MQSTSPRVPYATSSASDCRWKRGRPVTSPTRALGTAHPASRPTALQVGGARRPTDTGLYGTLSRGIASAPRFSQASCTPSICTAAGVVNNNHHPAVAHTFGSSVTDTRTTVVIKEPDQDLGHGSRSAHYLSSPEDAVMSGIDDSREQATGSRSAVDQDYEDESGEDNATEQDEDLSEEHVPLTFQIPEDSLRAAMLASPNTRASFWNQNLYRGPNNEKLSVHYCRTPEVADRVAQYFLSEKIVGFDIEWKPRSNPHSIKKNASLIQLACENRIALFHISLFPGTTAEQLMPANLKAVLESPDVCKVGVAIKGDFSRLNRHLGIQPQGVFELSRLRNLVEWYATDPSKVSNRLVNLAAQVLQHLQLPLYKGGQLLDDDAEDVTNVRESDWSQRLDLQQINYAAADAYAGFRLYDVLEWKRKQLRPTPPRPQLCDYDSKSASKSKDTRQKPETEKQPKNIVDADAVSATPVISQTQEPDQASDDDGYETAQEDLMDSHQLEDPAPSSLSASSASTANVDEAPYKQVGRVNLSLWRGPDPGYPVLPGISDDEQAEPPRVNCLDISPSMPPVRCADSDDSASRTPDETLSSKEDEFEDLELENALQELELDSDGTLKSKTSTLTSAADSAQENTTTRSAPQSLAEADHDTSSTTAVLTPQYILATTWAQDYLTSSIPQPGSSAPPRIRATVPHLRAYHLWHHQGLPLEDIAWHLRDPPLSLSTVGGYVLQAVTLESMQYDEKALREVVLGLPDGLKRGRWKKLAERVGA